MKKLFAATALACLLATAWGQTNRTYNQVIPDAGVFNGGALLPEADGTVSYCLNLTSMSMLANDSNLTWPTATIPSGFQGADTWGQLGNNPFRLHWDTADSTIYGSGPYEHNPMSGLDSDRGFVMRLTPGRDSVTYASLAFPVISGLSRLWNVLRTDYGYLACGYVTEGAAGSKSVLVSLDHQLQLRWARRYSGVPQFKDVILAPDGSIYASGSNKLMHADALGNILWTKSYPDLASLNSLVLLDADRIVILGTDTSYFNVQLLQVNAQGNVQRARWFIQQGGLGSIVPTKVIMGFDNTLCMAGFATISNAPWNLWAMATDTMGNLVWGNTWHVGESDCLYDLVSTQNCNYAVLGTYFDGNQSTSTGTLIARFNADGYIGNSITTAGWISGNTVLGNTVSVSNSDSSMTTPLTLSTITTGHMGLFKNGFFSNMRIDSTRVGCTPTAVGMRLAMDVRAGLRWRTDGRTHVQVLAPVREWDAPLPWQLTSMDGQALARGVWDGGQDLQVPIGSLAAGIYLLHWPGSVEFAPIKVLKW